jgi:hypothetical protein
LKSDFAKARIAPGLIAIFPVTPRGVERSTSSDREFTLATQPNVTRGVWTLSLIMRVMRERWRNFPAKRPPIPHLRPYSKMVVGAFQQFKNQTED